MNAEILIYIIQIASDIKVNQERSVISTFDLITAEVTISRHSFAYFE